MRVCLFLVIDGLKLEAQACLLLPSLRRHLGNDVSVIAYRRQDADALQPTTEQVLAACNVELRDIPGTGPNDPDPWVEPYPVGNKILAASDPRDCDISVFIDTDMVFVAPIDFAALMEGAEIAAVISDYSTHSNTEDGWRAFYGLYGLDLPEERVNLLGGRRLQSLPYFNAGMIAFREKFGPDKLSFGAEWLKDTLRFDHEMTLPILRVNIDQLTLPITARRLGQSIKQLSNEFNYNIQAYGGLEDEPKALLHYHKFGVLWANAHFGKPVLDDLRDVLQDPTLAAFFESFMPILRRKRLKHLL